MKDVAGKTYVFGEYRLETATRLVVRNVDGAVKPIRLAKLPFGVLSHLIENRDRIVSRDELLAEFWDGREVYDEAVTKCVGTIRKALDEPGRHNLSRFIETRWGGGYRFIGVVEEHGPVDASFVEIERTREVKIIYEESNENEAIRTQNTAPSIVAKRSATLPAFSRKTLGTVVTAIFLLAGAAYFTSRYESKPVPIRAIAVLPFKNLSSNPQGEVFSDGITESMISSLSRIEGLKVASRNSVAVFDGNGANPQAIAERLGVQAFLEGSVREDDNRVLVEVRLVNAENGQILWSSQEYDQPIGDLFEIQDDISRNVASRIRLKLSPAAERLLTQRRTSSAEAYQSYVKGRFFWKKKDAESLEKARKFFEEAIAADPNYSLAYIGLLNCYLSGIWYADLPPETALTKAKATYARIAQIDDELPEAHSARARIASADWEWDTCRKELEKALELNPSDADSWQSYAFVLLNYDERVDEAINAIKRAQELDPLSPSISTDVGVMLLHAGRNQEAIETFKKTLDTDPQFFDDYWNLGLAYERNEMPEEAVGAFLQSERLKGKGEAHLAKLRMAFEHARIIGFWRKWTEILLNESKEKQVPPYVLASFYARTGDREAALEWLERSYAAHDPYLAGLKSEPAFEQFRSDPRFVNLLERVGLNK